MTNKRMIELLEIEHECMLRGSHDDCDRNCSDCELVQDDDELHEMYTNVICLMKDREPVKPSWSRGKPYCGKCGRMIWPRKYDDEFERKFCSYCGRMVDWT